MTVTIPPDYWDGKVLRQGRKVSRTLYLTQADDPDGDGHLIGMVDTAELATEIVRRWNTHQHQPNSKLLQELEIKNNLIKKLLQELEIKNNLIRKYQDRIDKITAAIG